MAKTRADSRPVAKEENGSTARIAGVAGLGLVWAAFFLALGAPLLALLAAVAAVLLTFVLLRGNWLRSLDLSRLLARAESASEAGVGAIAVGLRGAAGLGRRAGTVGLWALTHAREATSRVSSRTLAALPGRLWMGLRPARSADHARETQRWVKEGLRRLRPVRAPAGWRLAQRSRTLRRQGRIDDSIAAAKAAAAAFRRDGDTRAEALAVNSLAIALAEAHQLQEAATAFDVAFGRLIETDARHDQGKVLANLGTLHYQTGAMEAARFCWSRALERLEGGSPEARRTAALLRRLENRLEEVTTI